MGLVTGNQSASPHFQSKILTKKSQQPNQHSDDLSTALVSEGNCLTRKRAGVSKGLAGWPEVDNTPNWKENLHMLSHGLMLMVHSPWPKMAMQYLFNVTSYSQRGHHTHLYFGNDYSSHFFFCLFETQNYGVSHADTQGLCEVCDWPTFNLIHFVLFLQTWPQLFSHCVWSVLIGHQTGLLYSLFLGMALYRVRRLCSQSTLNVSQYFKSFLLSARHGGTHFGLSTLEPEVDESLWVQDQPCLHGEFQASQGLHSETLASKKINKF